MTLRPQHRARKGSSKGCFFFLFPKPDDSASLLPCSSLTINQCVSKDLCNWELLLFLVFFSIWAEMQRKTHRDGEWLELSHLLPGVSAVMVETQTPFLSWWRRTRGAQEPVDVRVFRVWSLKASAFPRGIPQSPESKSLSVFSPFPLPYRAEQNLALPSWPFSLRSMCMCVCEWQVHECVCVCARLCWEVWTMLELQVVLYQEGVDKRI